MYIVHVFILFLTSRLNRLLEKTQLQLRYVIRDKIQSETKFSLRQNSVRNKIQSDKKNSQKKKILGFCLRLYLVLDQILSQTVFCLGLNFVSDCILSQCVSSAFFELSRTNQCLSSLSAIYIPQ